MRANVDQEKMEMESRDLNYILPAYVRSYMYISKNIDPTEIIFPMFESCPHPFKPGVTIPIRYVPALSPEALEITVDGQDVPEAKVEEEPVIEKVEPPEIGDHIEEEKIAEADVAAEAEDLKSDMTHLTEPLELEPVPEDEVVDGLTEEEEMYEAAGATFEVDNTPKEPTFKVGDNPPPPDRVAKQPEKPATGSPDEMQSRDKRADQQIAKDIAVDKPLDESKGQKAFDKTLTKGEDGEPKVEE